MTEYKTIVDAFKDCITDPNLLRYTQDIQTDIMHSYIKYACAKFNRICKKDLSKRSDEIEEFEDTLSDEEVYILANWMVEAWAKPLYNNLENMRNQLNTKEFTYYSPANLLAKVRDTYIDARKCARSEMNEYSFVHSDLEHQKS